MTRFLLLGQPGTRRTEGFLSACRSHGLPGPEVVPWSRVLAADFDPAAAFSGADVLRIETPSDCPAAERLLLRRGAEIHRAGGTVPELNEDACDRLPDDDGRVRHQRQWHLGFRAVLGDLSEWCGRFGVRAMNDPLEIAVLFDKASTRAALGPAGVPIPPSGGICEGFDHLAAMMDTLGWDRVFLKPCHGSSAAGVMAIARNRRGDWRAVTTASVEHAEIRNLNRPREIRDLPELRSTVDAVARQSAIVERWFPKATLGGRAFDLRVLVVAEEAAHVAVRTSRGPITNLHLDNRRGDPDAVRRAFGDEAWAKALDAAERADSRFPGCHYTGVDVMIGTDGRNVAVAEVNAFGDLLHHERWNGRNSWELEVARWQALRAV